MKLLENVSKRQLLVFVLMSICSGLMIGIGGTASLYAAYAFGKWGKLIGAILFSLGIFEIVTYEMRLFTGMVADLPKMGGRSLWKLPICFVGNVLGVAFIAVLVYFTPLKDIVITQSKLLVANKLGAKYWGLSALCSSILCGALITLSVWSVKYSPRKGLDATLGVTFPIIVFAFCGFDHSVANVLYFFFNGALTWQIVCFELLCILGNILGGIILPCISLLREQSRKMK